MNNVDNTPLNIVIGGFPTPTYPKGEPELKYLFPTYPPKPNVFYHLDANARLTARWFERNDRPMPEKWKAEAAQANNAQRTEIQLATPQVIDKKENLHPDNIKKDQITDTPVQTRVRERSATCPGLLTRGLTKNKTPSDLELSKKDQELKKMTAEEKKKEAFEAVTLQAEDVDGQIGDWFQEQAENTKGKALYNHIYRPLTQVEREYQRMLFALEAKHGKSVERQVIDFKVRETAQVERDEFMRTKDTEIKRADSILDAKKPLRYTQLPGSRCGYNSRTGRTNADLEQAMFRTPINISSHATSQPIDIPPRKQTREMDWDFPDFEEEGDHGRMPPCKRQRSTREF